MFSNENNGTLLSELMRLFFRNLCWWVLIIIILNYPQNKPFDASSLEEAKNTGNKEADVRASLRGKKNSHKQGVAFKVFQLFLWQKIILEEIGIS